MQNLVIVESPTKARTLSKYLGDQYQIEASYGHVRDLPKGDLGIDVEHNFLPKYIVPKLKSKRVNELKKLAKEAEILWLASDPDREGEAIAWHLKELLARSGLSVERVVFHEITEEAIKKAFDSPRDLDLNLVDAQQARRILDRLVGYTLSPLLWKKIQGGLSAGRVQSVALRLIVEKEAEVTAFKPVEYWSIEAELSAAGSPSVIASEAKQSPMVNQKIAASPSAPRNDNAVFTATLIEKNDKKLEIKNKNEADLHLKALENTEYKVSKVTKREVRKTPPPPFTTSTLQQTSSNHLGYSAKKTMSLAQTLYEHGLITYMRTDSVNLADSALSAARTYIEQNMGKAYLPKVARIYKTQSKSAQEAHEAIRPTNLKTTGEELKVAAGLTRDHVRLYELIWKRMMACQMSEAVMDQTSIDVIARSETTKQSTGDGYLFRATGSVLKFDGWLKVYVEKREKKFFPTELGIGVMKFLMKYFADIFDYSFTAEMEDEFDNIADGKSKWQPVIKKFYDPFAKKVATVMEEAEKVKIETEKIDKNCPKCGKPLQIKFGKFGKFLACMGFPDCKHTENIENKIDVKCPDCGGDILLRKTRKGRPFYGCKNWPKCKFASWTKPKGVAPVIASSSSAVASSSPVIASGAKQSR